MRSSLSPSVRYNNIFEIDFVFRDRDHIFGRHVSIQSIANVSGQYLIPMHRSHDVICFPYRHSKAEVTPSVTGIEHPTVSEFTLPLRRTGYAGLC